MIFLQLLGIVGGGDAVVMIGRNGVVETVGVGVDVADLLVWRNILYKW